MFLVVNTFFVFYTKNVYLTRNNKNGHLNVEMTVR